MDLILDIKRLTIILVLMLSALIFEVSCQLPFCKNGQFSSGHTPLRGPEQWSEFFFRFSVEFGCGLDHPGQRPHRPWQHRRRGLQLFKIFLSLNGF